MKPPTESAYEEAVAAILRELNIAERRTTPLYYEAGQLVVVGKDIYDRDLELSPATAKAWERLKSAASAEGLTLLAVSGFRSLEKQKSIIERKLRAGQTLGEILRVNAAPGYSEHHTGRAIDITAPDGAPLTQEFETRPEFLWLCRSGEAFGFSMTYPRNNRFGIDYEPWHWAFQEKIC